MKVCVLISATQSFRGYINTEPQRFLLKPGSSPREKTIFRATCYLKIPPAAKSLRPIWASVSNDVTSLFLLHNYVNIRVLKRDLSSTESEKFPHSSCSQMLIIQQKTHQLLKSPCSNGGGGGRLCVINRLLKTELGGTEV